MDHATLFDVEIKPRSVTDEIVPRLIDVSIEPRPDRAREIATQAITARKFLRAITPDADAEAPNSNDGPTQSDILLQAIVIVARKEPQTAATRAAMRSLIAKFSCECGLGF